MSRTPSISIKLPANSARAVDLRVSELRAIIRDVLISLRDEERVALESDAACLSLVRAAKMAHRREGDVRAAVQSGALPGHQAATGHWRITKAAVREWTAAGCPITPPASPT